MSIEQATKEEIKFIKDFIDCFKSDIDYIQNCRLENRIEKLENRLKDIEKRKPTTK